MTLTGKTHTTDPATQSETADDSHSEAAASTDAAVAMSARAAHFLALLQDALEDLDWDTALRRWGSPEAIAEAVIAMIPYENHPQFGLLYTAQQIAALRPMSAQAVHQQRKRGRLLGLRRGRRWLFPAIQLDRFYWPSTAFQEALERAPLDDPSAEEIFAWVHALDADGTSPADRIATRELELERVRMPFSWELTIADPRDHVNLNEKPRD